MAISFKEESAETETLKEEGKAVILLLIPLMLTGQLKEKCSESKIKDLVDLAGLSSPTQWPRLHLPSSLTLTQCIFQSSNW